MKKKNALKTISFRIPRRESEALKKLSRRTRIAQVRIIRLGLMAMLREMK